MVLYIAPTATGKTLSPIGLSEKYRIIFVCAARHVGLALAKSALSVGKKIALGFNCKDAEDIRLHFSAAKEYTKNFRTGGIFKVDNSVGDNVEIMICDIKSYLPAMYYMCAFNDKKILLPFGMNLQLLWMKCRIRCILLFKVIGKKILFQIWCYPLLLYQKKKRYILQLLILNQDLVERYIL